MPVLSMRGRGRITSGPRLHYVRFFNPPDTPDGDGGYGGAPVATVPPGSFASVTPATAQNLERVTAGTVMATATHLVQMLYRDDVTTKTIVTFGDRTFAVTSVQNPDERNRELVLVCVEQGV